MAELIGVVAPYAGLFLTAFLAATLLPAQSELVFAAMLSAGRYDPAALLLTATAGNTLGSIVNWALGRFVEHFRERKWFPFKPEQVHRAERWYARWGKWSLLLSWAPLIGDLLTLGAGLMRTPLATFTLLVLIAKGGRYLAILAAVINT